MIDWSSESFVFSHFHFLLRLDALAPPNPSTIHHLDLLVIRSLRTVFPSHGLSCHVSNTIARSSPPLFARADP